MPDTDLQQRVADLEAEVDLLRDALALVVDGTNAALDELRERTLTAVRDTAHLLAQRVDEVAASRSGPLVLQATAAPGPTRKRIEHDEDGRIVGIIEEPS